MLTRRGAAHLCTAAMVHRSAVHSHVIGNRGFVAAAQDKAAFAKSELEKLGVQPVEMPYGKWRAEYADRRIVGSAIESRGDIGKTVSGGIGGAASWSFVSVARYGPAISSGNAASKTLIA